MDDSQLFLKEDDVLSAPTSALMYQSTFKVSEFTTIMQSRLLEDKLFSDGMDCEVLSSGKSWTKGKLRMRLEFYPETEIKELKALPAASEESNATQNYGEDNSQQVDTNDEENVSDSPQITNNFPISRYPDSHPHSLGMWS